MNLAKKKAVLGIGLAIALTMCMTMPAFAASQGDVDVYGHIGAFDDPTIDPGGDPDTPDTDYDVTFTSGVHWWVTPASAPNVVDGDATGPDPLVSNRILNNNSQTTIKVSFDSFTQANVDAATAATNGLVLNLTGDLAADTVGTLNLATDQNTPVPYTATLTSTTPWTFGFSGTYTAALTATGLAPQYEMELGFEFA